MCLGAMTISAINVESEGLVIIPQRGELSIAG